MKNKILAMAAISSLCLLGACSEDEADPTRAELCASGLSADCLIGTWNLNGAYEVVLNEDGTVTSSIFPDHNFSASPSKLTFNEGGKFEFDLSKVNHATCAESPVYGDWSISGKTLTLRTKNGNTCMNPKTWTGTPGIKVNGAVVEMDIPGIFFLNSEMEYADESEKINTHEIFTISAN
ncbi:MAG: lipocalin family protein [Fibrobacter sp.]|nr:lipocalin family protein [Fibrobacter sp.]